jgi:uncharacterized protein YyaL (SSP411 family)
MASKRSLINWREWGNEALQQAENEDKLILLNISAPWCHWCHVMDRTTYSDAEVAKILAERFIPIKVDADRRPDIQNRYLLGGWPTTAFLVPDGRILTGTTFIPPDTMVFKLREVDDLYHEQKAIVTMHVTSMAAEAEAERAETEVPGGLDLTLIPEIENTLRKEFDPAHGGFGSEPKFPYPDAVRFAFLQYRKTGAKDMLEIALKTLEGQMQLCDPVWGGSYRYAVSPDWSQPHYEKMLYVQAGATDNYLEAYQVTGEDKYGEVAAGVKAYLTRFMTDPNGGFYASQDADIGSHDPETELTPGEKYYTLDEAGRLALGMPYVDRSIYTDWNAMAVCAYMRLYHVMGDEDARDFACQTIDRITGECMKDDHMCHYHDGEARLPGILSDQVYFAQALVDAYQTVGKRQYLDNAQKLVGFMVNHLRDVIDGGFYFQLFDPSVKGEPLERHKPFDENVAAAKLLIQLHYLTGYDNYRELAERTLKAIAYPQLTDSIVGVGFACALDLHSSHPVHIVLVGDRDDEETQKMLETSLHTYEPQKLVQVLDPDEDPLTIGEVTYEAEERPMAYVCVRNVCLPPVSGSEDLVVVLEDVIQNPVGQV